jgi:hypothetical protein
MSQLPWSANEWRPPYQKLETKDRYSSQLNAYDPAKVGILRFRYELRVRPVVCAVLVKHRTCLGLLAPRFKNIQVT